MFVLPYELPGGMSLTPGERFSSTYLIPSADLKVRRGDNDPNRLIYLRVPSHGASPPHHTPALICALDFLLAMSAGWKLPADLQDAAGCLRNDQNRRLNSSSSTRGGGVNTHRRCLDSRTSSRYFPRSAFLPYLTRSPLCALRGRVWLDPFSWF